MKFTIARTWDKWSSADREKYKTQFDSSVDDEVINIDSLDELIVLIKESDEKRVVIESRNEVSHIEIYDDYRE